MRVDAFHADEAQRRRGRRSDSARLLLAFPLAVVLASSVPAPSHAATLQITIERGRMSAEIGSVPVADILTAVARQTGAQVKAQGDLGTARPQAFTMLPLGEALPRLVQPNGVILEFGPDSDRDGNPRLLRIRVIAPGSPGPAPGSGSASVTSLDRRDPRRGMPPSFWDYALEDVPLPEITQRTAMLEKLARGGKPGAARVLTYVLHNDPDTAVRQSALGLLASMKGDEVRTALTEAVADADPQVRMDALRALSAAGRQKPIPLLAQTAKGDTDPGVRVAAIGLLSRQDGDLARAVLEGARGDADPQIREAAEQALRR